MHQGPEHARMTARAGRMDDRHHHKVAQAVLDVWFPKVCRSTSTRRAHRYHWFWRMRGGADADERITRPGMSALGRLEQEGADSAGELAIDADGALTVGQQGAGHRHHAVRGDLLGELLAAGADRADAAHALTWRAPESKQVASPVWQAAPVCATLTSSASPSQSSATERTCCTCPEVSPFTQYSWRLRDQ